MSPRSKSLTFFIFLENIIEPPGEEIYQPFPEDLVDWKTASDINNTFLKEYEKIREKFVDCKPTKELLDDLEKLAQKGFDQAAIDIGHYAMEYSSERERAKKLLKNAKDPYATHLLGVLAVYEGSDEDALELFFKAHEMGVSTSLASIVFAIEGNPDLKSGKYAHQIEKALLDYDNFSCC